MATVVAVTTFFTLAIMVTVAVVIAVVAMNKWKNPHTFGGDKVAPGLSKTTPTFPT